MSGHSKWHSIRHKKGANDAKRGKILTKHSKLLTIAGRSDPNPETNPTLRVAIANAKADNVPNDNVQRVLKKLAGDDKNASQFEQMVYEGFGPDGVPFVVTALTDNGNRTTPAVKSAFGKNGGTMGSSGTVMYMFDHVGVIEIHNGNHAEDVLFEIAIEAGAQDFHYDENTSEVVTAFADLARVSNVLESKGIVIQKSEPQYRAKEPKIVSESEIDRLEKFMSALEEIDDVDDVFGGFDVEE